jgi:protein gp37
MGENSAIEWTHHTFNPWIGCMRVSPGCDYCYAARDNARWKWVGGGDWGKDRRRTSEANWRKPLQWNAAAAPYDRRRVFCASLADWLDNEVPQEWREDLFALIEKTPNLDWLLLTKRIGNFHRFTPAAWSAVGTPSNVWIGITCVNQQEYERDWPKLRGIRARVRFISHEPALGPLWLDEGSIQPDWIITGGESGPHARHADEYEQWAREMKAVCEYTDVQWFHKQMVGKAPIPPDLVVRQFPR